MDTIDPSSTKISDPGQMLPRLATSLVVLAVTATPAARSSLVAFCDVAVPTTGPAHACAAAARARVLPVPAGPVITSVTRGEVSACHTAVAWSRRNPAR